MIVGLLLAHQHIRSVGEVHDVQPQVFVLHDGKNLSLHARLGRVSAAGETDLVPRTGCAYVLRLRFNYYAIDEVPTVAIRATCDNEISLVQIAN